MRRRKVLFYVLKAFAAFVNYKALYMISAIFAPFVLIDGIFQISVVFQIFEVSLNALRVFEERAFNNHGLAVLFKLNVTKLEKIFVLVLLQYGQIIMIFQHLYVGIVRGYFGITAVGKNRVVYRQYPAFELFGIVEGFAFILYCAG